MKLVPSGFTLVEVIAVMVIAAVIAAGAALYLGGPDRDAKSERAVSRIVEFDAIARATARASGTPLQVTINVSKQRLSRFRVSNSELTAGRVELDGEVFLEEVRQAGTLTPGTIAISERGFSRSYALKLRSPNARTRWLLFIGLTGRALEVDNESEVSLLLRPAPARNDTR